MSETLEQAYIKLDEGREGRPDPMTAGSHTDHWLNETPVYIAADLARGNVESAQGIVDFWLDAQAASGRIPHMVINTADPRRRFIDGPVVQQASWQHNGHMITPFTGLPVMAANAAKIAEAQSGKEGNESDAWLTDILPVLERASRWRYAARDIDNTGLPTAIYADELMLRHSPLTAQVLAGQPGNWLTRLEARMSGKETVQRGVSSFRRWQGDDQKGLESSTYDPSQFMEMDTAAAAYSAVGVALRNRYSARRIAQDTNKDGTPTGFLVQDVATSALLINDNKNLLRIYERLGLGMPTDIAENIEKTREGFQLHWDEKEESFKARSPRTGELYEDIGAPEALLVPYALPALSGLQCEAVLRKLYAHTPKRAYSLVSSAGETYDPGAIHRGAVDPVLNMFVSESIRGYDALGAFQQRVVSHVGQLASLHGFARSYHAETGEPLGQDWNPSRAALIALDAK